MFMLVMLPWTLLLSALYEYTADRIFVYVLCPPRAHAAHMQTRSRTCTHCARLPWTCCCLLFMSTQLTECFSLHTHADHM